VKQLTEKPASLKAEKPREKHEEKADFKGRLRIAGKEINGHDKVAKAIGRIKGVGSNLSESISEIIENEMHVPRDEKIGNLTEEQLAKVEEIVSSPQNHGIPEWMLNRKKDPETGKSKHLISSDLDFVQKNDVKEEINMRSYRGTRHMFGLTCRGQRTKTSGRKGLSLGVQKKKEMPGAAKGGKEEKKK
jgi:small subunit ribosomal protein S13